MNITDVFGWIEQAAQGGLDVVKTLASGTSNLFVDTNGETVTLTILGALVIAAIGAPLAMKFIKYIISLFKKVRTN